MNELFALMPLACAVCVVLSACRFQFNLGLAERPLVAGVIWGALVGPMHTAVSVALFFELLWMDLIPAGTYLPPQMPAATLAALSLVTGLHLNTAGQAVAALFLALPVAMLCRSVELGERQRLNAQHDALMAAVAEHDGTFAPHRVIFTSLGRTALLTGVAFWACTSLAGVACLWLAPPLESWMGLARLEWWQLWFGASIGGLLSLRYRPAYVVALAAVLGVAVLSCL